jgi:NOL1/NOP2/fmu family ribosome biogenesis protein
MGLYVAAYMKGKLRLTIEGAQLIGPHATKNVVALNDEETAAWLAGGNIPLDIIEADVESIPDGTFVIVKHAADWLGCGRKADAFLYNYVPKSRHTHATFDAVSQDEE